MPTESLRSPRADVPLGNPFPRILCAVDGSRASRHAVAQALALAGTDGELTYLTVSDPRARGTASAYAADAAVEAAFRAAGTVGVDAGLLVRHGVDPSHVILDEARRHDLLVLGTHGRHRTAGFLLGSTAIAALHRSPVPVLIARRTRAGTRFPRDILLATDGSPAMAETVAVTAVIACRHRARVVLLHVGDADHAVRHELAEEATSLYLATGTEPVTLQLEGPAPARIAELALELPASLVVAGSRMLTGVRAVRSVSERTGALAPCSMLVMRHP